MKQVLQKTWTFLVFPTLVCSFQNSDFVKLYKTLRGSGNLSIHTQRKSLMFCFHGHGKESSSKIPLKAKKIIIVHSKKVGYQNWISYSHFNKSLLWTVSDTFAISDLPLPVYFKSWKYTLSLFKKYILGAQRIRGT